MRENKKTNVELFKEKIDGSEGTNWNGKPQADYVTGELYYRKDQSRGYHLRVSIQTEGDGFIMFCIGSGVMLGKYVEQTARFNEKRLIELAANT